MLLQVDNATIFFKSIKKKQHVPVIKIVNSNRILNKNELLKYNKKSYRIANQTPAATNVEEWTNELTGVGARIASSNQLINGNLALLVNKIKKYNINATIKFFIEYPLKHINKNKHTSPNREETSVTIEERKLR